MIWVSSMNLKDQPSHMDVEFWSELTNLETMFLWKSHVIFNCKSELSEFIYYNSPYQCIAACCTCRNRIRITVRHKTTGSKFQILDVYYMSEEYNGRRPKFILTYCIISTAFKKISISNKTSPLNDSHSSSSMPFIDAKYTFMYALEKPAGKYS